MLQSINKDQVKKFKTVAKGGLFLAAVLCFLFCFFTPVFAQEGSQVQENITPNNLDLGLVYAEQIGLPTTDIREIIANIIRVALGLLGIIALVIVLYGGWLWMTAGGNEDQIGKAKKTLINGAVGLVIILSAYSIVVFVMGLLGIGEGSTTTGGDYNYRQPGIMNIAGSGAWGKVILDHYPLPNQMDVPRNTKIAVTFAKPIKFDSLTDEILDGDGKTIFKLKNNVIKINALIPSSTLSGGYERQLVSDAQVYKFPIETVLADGSTTTEIFTIVIEPDSLLGDRNKKVSYEVRIENTLLGNDNKPIFSASKISFYQWYFTCSTELDTSPPWVVSVYPSNGIRETKDTIIEINFNEPIFPNAQVSFGGSGGDYYQDKINTNPIVFLKSNSSTVPLGTFKITNQYRTLEFISTDECGTDACGLPKYCVPVCDKEGANCIEDTYQVVFKTAPATTDPEKPPFTADLSVGSGIMDMAGNAMDGDKDGNYDRNIINPFVSGFSNPDNYGWSFTLEDELDLTTPFIKGLSIGPETEMVLKNEDMFIAWSKLMKKSSLYSIGIDEYPSPEERCGILVSQGKISNIRQCSTETLGRVPSSTDFSPEGLPAFTYTQILHTPFLDGFDQYYLPEINSDVKDNKGNCYYPGKGPSGERRNVVCNSQANCCVGPYCCNGIGHKNPFTGTYSSGCYESLISAY